MTTALFTHADCVEHDPGPGHPERPDRLRAVLAALEDAKFDALDRHEAPIGDRENIGRVHPSGQITRIFDAIPESGYHRLNPDTALSPESGAASLRATGALCAATDAVMTGAAKNAFCAVRTPGHHAEPARAMGFCLFNNVAIAARYAQAKHGAVIDFDVHHGNGTQAIFEADPDLFYASSHQSPAYPGTGAASEAGVGNVVNTPLPPGTGSAPFRAAYRDVILPALDNFAPDLLLISAGFDAHQRDPLCQLNLTTEDFVWISDQLVAAADKFCRGKIVSALEGGYDLDALAESTAAHVTALMGA